MPHNTTEIVKLYEIPQGSKIKLTGMDGEVKEGFITFHKIDGMYSYCTCDWLEENQGNAVHISAVTPLKKVEDYYEISLPQGL